MLSYANEIVQGSFGASNAISLGVIFDDILDPSSTDIIFLSLDILIRDKLEYNLNETRIQSSYAFDNHPESEYPNHSKTVPSKFLVHDSTDVIITKSHKSYLNNTELTVTPSVVLDIEGVDQKIDVSSIHVNPRDSALVFICDSDTLFDVDIYPWIIEDIHIYRLAESDDDYANYCVNFDGDSIHYEVGDVQPYLLADCTTPINSLPNPESFECINPGLDGSIDLFFETTQGYWLNRMDNDPSGSPDNLIFNPNLLSSLKIHPGKDASGEYRCNSRPVTLPSQWNTDRDGDGEIDTKVTSNVPFDINLNEIKISLNDIYNQIGVKFNVIDMSYDTLNYNASSFVGNTNPEIKYIHYSLIGGDKVTNIKTDEMIIFFIDEMIIGNKFKEYIATSTGNPANSLGKGMTENGKGLNTCFINANFHLNPETYRPRTLPHEVGHGMYSIFHPDDQGGVNHDKLSSKVKSDRYNFMNSGKLYNCCSVKNVQENRVRKYQWKYIRDGK